jgi:hypothetical protein
MTTLTQTAVVSALPSKFVLSIEPTPDPNPAPSDTKPFAGVLACTGDSCTGNADAATGTGIDLTGKSGIFTLAAPTGSNQGSAYFNGIWFFDPNNTPFTPLNIPNAPAGWKWEGWVVKGSPISTGTFTNVTGLDSDQAGPEAGTNPGVSAAPPFPGQDFVVPPRDLSDGYTAVISLEPNPDDSAAPFFFKPLTKSIQNTTSGQAFAVAPFSNVIAVTVRLVSAASVLSASFGLAALLVVGIVIM